MHSLLDGSDVDCVTSVNPVGVTAIEVDPIHGYVIIIIITSTSYLQPSTANTNQLPVQLVSTQIRTIGRRFKFMIALTVPSIKILYK